MQGTGVLDGSAVTYRDAEAEGMLMSGPNRANKFKRKKRSCAMCKPNKTGGAHRFEDRERAVRRDPPAVLCPPHECRSTVPVDHSSGRIGVQVASGL